MLVAFTFARTAVVSRDFDKSVQDYLSIVGFIKGLECFSKRLLVALLLVLFLLQRLVALTL